MKGPLPDSPNADGKWQTEANPRSGQIHIWPTRSRLTHARCPECWCSPTVELVKNTFVVTHRQEEQEKLTELQEMLVN